MDKDSEYILILGLRCGDEDAYRKLYDFHYVLLCKFANQLIRDPFWAQTIVDDVIFRIWEMKDTFEIHTSLRSYLLRAVRNSCLNYIAQSSTKHEIYFSQLNSEIGLSSIPDGNEYPLGRLLELELEKEIILAVEALSEECKLVFKKSRYEYKKNAEIATELNISVNTVKYHIKNALSFLRERLEKYLTASFLFCILFF